MKVRINKTVIKHIKKKGIKSDQIKWKKQYNKRTEWKSSGDYRSTKMTN